MSQTSIQPVTTDLRLPDDLKISETCGRGLNQETGHENVAFARRAQNKSETDRHQVRIAENTGAENAGNTLHCV